MSAKRKVKPTRGGARPGAGRPRVGEGKSYKVLITIDAETMRLIKGMAKEESSSVPGAIRTLINTGLKNRRLN